MDYDKYRWQSSETNPNIHRRSIVGAEHIVDFQNRYVRGQHNLMMGCDVNIVLSTSSDVLRAARQAWTALRFAVPTVATLSEVDPAGERLLMYRVAADQEDAAAWAERTVRLLEAATWHDAHEKLSQLSLPEADSGDQTFIYIVPHNIAHYTFIVHTDHTSFDGTGIKILMSRFLANFARYVSDDTLAGQELSALQWGQEHANLLPSYTQVMADEKSLFGLEHDETATQILQDIQRTCSHAHRHSAQRIIEAPDVAGNLEYQFSKAETDRILQHCRANGFTLSELVHATINLSVLHDNPSPAADAIFMCLGIINLRGQLCAPYSTRHQFPGVCFGMACLAVPASHIMSVAPEMQLHAMAAGLKHEYAKMKTHPGLLGASATIFHAMVDAVKAGAPPPSTSPWFVGDGVAERDLDTNFSNDAGREVVEVTSLHLSIRQVDAAPCFRCTSLHGRLIIGVDYNGAVWPSAVIHGFMQNIVKILRFSKEIDD